MRKAIVLMALAIALAPVAQTAEPAGVVNRTTGVVKSLDAGKGTVTLAHGPVATLKWPAMTMPFKVSADIAKGISVGQKVDIEFEAQGMSATITKITVVK